MAPSTTAATPTASPKPGTFTINLPLSDLTGTLDVPSKGFDRSKLDGFLPGTIKFDWFRSTGGTMVALIFLGHLPAGQAPLCVGTLLKTAEGLEGVTNSPLGTGGCKGDDNNLATAPAGGQICNGGFLVYTTTIPNDAVARFPSLERMRARNTPLTMAPAPSPLKTSVPGRAAARRMVAPPSFTDTFLNAEYH
jgi:hypothetical protein